MDQPFVFFTISHPDDDAAWHEVSPGIRYRPLAHGQDGALVEMFVRFDPNISWKGVDLHPKAERLLIINGGLFLGHHPQDDLCGPGTHIYAPAGTFHIPRSSADGCCLIAYYPDGWSPSLTG